MKVTFYSNFLNHHQLPFCLAMRELLGDDFVFVASTPVPDFRIKFGYEDMNHKYPFVLTIYDNKDNLKRSKELIAESDITIHGSAPDEYLHLREKTRRPGYFYSERLFKPGNNKAAVLRTYLAYMKHHLFRNNSHMYLLCASCYSAYDYSVLGAYVGRSFAWGYFPQNNTYNIDDLLQKKRIPKEPILLWAGRMLELKHPEAAIQTAHYLSEKNINYHLIMIGDGPQKALIEKMIDSYNLQDKIELTGSMPAENVRQYMENASVFLFTSDYNEGWGAVLNESMNSGCAVIASHAIGSTGFLIENGENGIVYPNGDQDELNFWAEKLITNTALRELMGKNAYHTIEGTWNAKCAATRLIGVSKAIIQHENPDIYSSGPCSKVKKCSNNGSRKRVKKELMRIREKYGKEEHHEDILSNNTY